MEKDNQFTGPLMEIDIENYKSFTKQAIQFVGVTSIVGANETGKSNLLSAIYHLSPECQSTPFEPDEMRIGAPGFPKGEVRITYKISITESLLVDYLRILTDAVGAIILLTKRGKPKDDPIWEGKVLMPQHKLPDVIRIINKTKFKKEFQQNITVKKLAKSRLDKGWFLKDGSVDLRKQPFKDLFRDGAIALLTGQHKVGFWGDILKDIVLKNIKIFQWVYKEEDFLPEIVNIMDFIEDPSKFRTVDSMFRIADWEPEDYYSNLQDQSDMVYANLFEAVERKINSLIKANWSTHKKLKIDLQHKGTYFTIHLQQPGSRTPPEYRSDGLKWYLTFLINFRAHSKDFKNYILLIDEPGLHLHPRGQKDTLKELKELRLKHNNQVIYTTHQTFLIDKNRPEGVRVIERKLDRKGPLSKDPFFASQVNDVSDSRHSILTDKLLREALGFRVSDVSPINEKNILVEGFFDRDVLHLINRHGEVVDLNDTSIIACGGAPNIAKHAVLYVANGLRVVCLYDSDTVGKSSFDKNNKVSRKEKRQIRNYVQRDEYETMEDLIPDDVFDVAFEKWSKVWHISGNVPKRPRMKKLEKHIKGETRLEMKHSFEDILVEAIKKNVEKGGTEFPEVTRILEDLGRNLS